jgi:hypothetical protein
VSPASEPPVALCHLQLNSIPVADVALDGKALGDTPRRDVTASAGEHLAVFTAGDARRTVTFRCNPNEEKIVSARIP